MFEAIPAALPHFIK